MLQSNKMKKIANNSNCPAKNGHLITSIIPLGIIPKYKTNTGLAKRKPNIKQLPTNILNDFVPPPQPKLNNRYSELEKSDAIKIKSVEIKSDDKKGLTVNQSSKDKLKLKKQSPYLSKLGHGSVSKSMNYENGGGGVFRKNRNYSLQRNERETDEGFKDQQVQHETSEKSFKKGNYENSVINRKKWRSEPRKRNQTQQNQKVNTRLLLKLKEDTSILNQQSTRKQLKTEENEMNSSLDLYVPKISDLIKARIQEKKNKQSNIIKQYQKTKREPICIKILQKIIKVQEEDNGCGIVVKIFKHFGNLYDVYFAMKNKSMKKSYKKCIQPIIKAVREYVLEEEGDSADLEYLYMNQQIIQQASEREQETRSHPMVAKLLFLEKMAIIMLVEALITSKYNILESTFLKILETLIEFYSLVYSDLASIKNPVLLQQLNISQLSAFLSKDQLLLLQSGEKKQYAGFQYYEKVLMSHNKHCHKFLKPLQKFHQVHYKSTTQFPINFSYYKLLEFYSVQLLGNDWSEFGIQFLQTCPSPYLHFLNEKKFTLLLDLDETLIHFKCNPIAKDAKNTGTFGQFLIRPHLYQFLNSLANYYEIGIFTCGMPQYADIILDKLKNIEFRLYRHHTIRINGEYAKDLSRVGRQMSRMLIVDNLQRNFRLQKKNGISIRSWYGDKNDNMLMLLSQQLIKVAKQAHTESGQTRDLRQLQFRRQFL